MQLTVHAGAEAWLPTEAALAALRQRFPGPGFRVTLHPRIHVHQVHGGRTEPWAFRAFTRQGESHVFADGTETPASIAWLIAHELSHQAVLQNPEVRAAVREARPVDSGPQSDAFHRVDPEERIADGVATRLFGERLDRDWWRARTPVAEQARGAHGAVYGALAGCRYC
jgi:hypothetical protein